jgi:hypothetical protein
MIAPCIFVRYTFWLGCDRYLYIPLALFCLALACTSLCERLPPFSRVARGALEATVALALIFASYLSAETYYSQTAFMMGMMRMRPDDPSGYLTSARWLWHRGQKDGAMQLLDRVPRIGLPAPLASQLARVLADFGAREQALSVVADMEARYPDDPFVALDVVSVRLDEGRVAEAAEKASALRAQAATCRAVRALFEAHLARSDFALRHGAETRAELARYACP